MASASTTSSTTAPKKPRKMPTAVKKELAAKRKRVTKPKVVKPRVLFLPGSLNDQISKLDIGESMAHVLRIPVALAEATLSSQAQNFFKAKNSVLSGGIAKVRSAPEHKDKRFTMERGSYMTASNDAMFAFLTITRTE
ncbi:MAG: hypothetical protein E7J78_12605 [Pantoea sp.]|nr:hypothetical protein [Pantoea sp.]